MNKLPCEECTKTKNHCCLADIPHHIADAMYFKHLANELNIECIVTLHPAKNVQDGMMVLVNKSMEGHDITQHSCIFLIDNKCAIYENRPTICRSYGTEVMPCRYEQAGLTKQWEIGMLNKEEIKILDEQIDINSIFNKLME